MCKLLYVQDKENASLLTQFAPSSIDYKSALSTTPVIHRPKDPAYQVLSEESLASSLKLNFGVDASPATHYFEAEIIQMSINSDKDNQLIFKYQESHIYMQTPMEKLPKGVYDKMSELYFESETIEITETPESAQAALENYWSAENTSQRIVDFGLAFYQGEDKSEFAKLLTELVDQTFAAVTGKIGELPQISLDTQVLVHEKLEQWVTDSEDIQTDPYHALNIAA